MFVPVTLAVEVPLVVFCVYELSPGLLATKDSVTRLPGNQSLPLSSLEMDIGQLALNLIIGFQSMFYPSLYLVGN